MRIIELQWNDSWAEIEFHPRENVFEICFTSSSFSPKSILCVSAGVISWVDPSADTDAGRKWIRRIYCKGSRKWRWEGVRWSGWGRGQEGQRVVSDRAGRELQVVVGSCTQESCETGKMCQAHATPTTDREAAKHVCLWAPSLAPFPCLLVPSLRGWERGVRKRCKKRRRRNPWFY